MDMAGTTQGLRRRVGHDGGPERGERECDA